MIKMAEILRSLFKPISDKAMEDLLDLLDDNRQAAESSINSAASLEKKLCLECGPNARELRRRYSDKAAS